MCLNGKPVDHFQASTFEKTCFLLINDYEDKHKYELGVGPLNDGYLMALRLHKLGFNIFYLYNPQSEEFGQYLAFFVKNTTKQLTVFYSGRVTNKNTGISFSYTALVKESIAKIVEENYNGETKLVFITDSLGSGPAFAVNSGPHKNMTSISAVKKGKPTNEDLVKKQGIFTYYLCKVLNECPTISPNQLAEKMNNSLSRFDEELRCENSDDTTANAPLYN